MMIGLSVGYKYFNGIERGNREAEACISGTGFSNFASLV